MKLVIDEINTLWDNYAKIEEDRCKLGEFLDLEDVYVVCLHSHVRQLSVWKCGDDHEKNKVTFGVEVGKLVIKNHKGTINAKEVQEYLEKILFGATYEQI